VRSYLKKHNPSKGLFWILEFRSTVVHLKNWFTRSIIKNLKSEVLNLESSSLMISDKNHQRSVATSAASRLKSWKHKYLCIGLSHAKTRQKI